MQQARKIKYKGKTYSIRGLAEVAGMSYATLRSRLNGGWDVEFEYKKGCKVILVLKGRYEE